ncbi:MAG: plasmid replication, integration and excision activator [Dehalococcoidia bacterium]
MAIKAKFKVSMEDVFPHGAYLVSEVEPVRDYDKSTPARPVQATDKESGLLMWAVSVLDADPEARRGDKTVTVKIAAAHQPIPPEAAPGMPFRPVEFDGLTVTPYVNESSGGRPRIAFSLRASGMRPPHTGAGRTATKTQDAA